MTLQRLAEEVEVGILPMGSQEGYGVRACSLSNAQPWSHRNSWKVELLPLRQGARPKCYSKPCSWGVAGRQWPWSQYNLPFPSAESTRDPIEKIPVAQAHDHLDGEGLISHGGVGFPRGRMITSRRRLRIGSSLQSHNTPCDPATHICVPVFPVT